MRVDDEEKKRVELTAPPPLQRCILLIALRGPGRPASSPQMPVAPAAPPALSLPDLPTTDHDFVLACRREAEAATGTADASQKTFQ